MLVIFFIIFSVVSSEAKQSVHDFTFKPVSINESKTLFQLADLPNREEQTDPKNIQRLVPVKQSSVIIFNPTDLPIITPPNPSSKTHKLASTNLAGAFPRKSFIPEAVSPRPEKIIHPSFLTKKNTTITINQLSTLNSVGKEENLTGPPSFSVDKQAKGSSKPRAQQFDIISPEVLIVANAGNQKKYFKRNSINASSRQGT